MRLRFHGHACFEVEGSAGRILIDPFINGPLWLKRRISAIYPEF